MASLHIINAGPRPTLLIKTIRELFPCGLNEAKECVEGTLLLEVGRITNGESPRIRDRLSGAGCVQYEILTKKGVAAKNSPPPSPSRTWHERLLDD